ncbi:Xaa-Pro aminopeptidase 1 [Gonapodya sp. JEL0774]|nr:Xaa-Pro aminopeptidase 1 [Gonapodya sp. JEL0774]
MVTSPLPDSADPPTFLPLHTHTSAPQLAALRHTLRLWGLDALVVEYSDAHGTSFEPPAAHKRPGFLTGYTQFGGTCAVTDTKAALWAGGLGGVMASHIVDTSLWDLPSTSGDSPAAWLARHVKRGGKVGFDPVVTTVGFIMGLESHLPNLSFLPTPTNPIDPLRPAHPAQSPPPLFSLSPSLTGLSLPAALSLTRRAIRDAGCSAMVVARMDEVAWLTGWRGGGGEYGGGVAGYVVVGVELEAGDDDEAQGTGQTVPPTTVFIDDAHFRPATDTHTPLVPLHTASTSPLSPPSVLASLAPLGVHLRPYEDVFRGVAEAAAVCAQRGQKVLMDPRTVVEVAVAAAGGWKARGDKTVTQLVMDGPILHRASPIEYLKSSPPAVQLSHFRTCHLRDCTAAVELFTWMAREVERRPATGEKELSELECVEKVEELRRLQAGYLRPSFGTISAFAGNTSMPTTPTPDRNLPFAVSGPYVHVSGGHYVDGTTNFTRVYFYRHPHRPRAPTPRERQVYTALLRCFIAGSSLEFPSGTTGYQIDSLIRRPLWDLRLDSSALQGHGIGFGTTVLEGPHGIGSEKVHDRVALREGNVVTIEPAVYVVGEVGYRLENTTVVVRAEGKGAYEGIGGERSWLRFDPVDFLPFERDLIDVEDLTRKETKWLDEYHVRVRETMLPCLDAYGSKGRGGVSVEEAKEWLIRHTRPLITT